jgi:prepilin signal peptidase PulO-like enzyme (type II secretory pathway)
LLYAALAVFLSYLAGAVMDGLLIAAGKMHCRSALPFGVFMAFEGS